MKMNRLGNWLPRAGVVTTTTMMLGLAMAACLTRPVGTQPPTTKVNFTSTQYQQAVDKVDILFAIDNSASMGDKQQILADAVPTLLNGLLNPRCVDPDTGAADPSGKRADPVRTKADRYGCTAPYDAEFVPVTDLHIGIARLTARRWAQRRGCSESARWDDGPVSGRLRRVPERYGPPDQP